MKPNTWIVVPLYNEAAVVRDTVEKLLPLGARIVVVDDGSTDGGAEKLAGLGTDPRTASREGDSPGRVGRGGQYPVLLGGPPSPRPSPVKGEGEFGVTVGAAADSAKWGQSPAVLWT
jgi:hypothetical protein